MYDPSTGKWYNVTPGGNTGPPDESGTPGYVPPSVTPVDAPAGASGVSNFVDPTSSDPRAIAAQLLAVQFGDWQKTFMPIELAAMNQMSTNNPNILPEAVNKAKATASGQSAAVGGILDRQNAAMGTAPTPQQKAVMSREINLNQAANVAGAENVARSNVRQQDQQLLLGAAPNPNIVRGTIQQ
jgi:hypothetical protein